jgi:8-oxo-dGTP pyrophosphatase MutT (NUDIX family)
MAHERLRVAAYAVCVRDGAVLLARWVGPEGRLWTLPGGGIGHGEDPFHAVRREVEEETGYRAEVQSLLGVHTMRRRYARRFGGETDFHALRIVYEARIVGGQLRDEVDGSTDKAAWIPLADVAALARVDLVDTGLELHRSRPSTGHLGR